MGDKNHYEKRERPNPFKVGFKAGQESYEASARAATGGECKSMQLTHNVRVGVDWGTLPQAQRQRWIALDCNRVVNSNATKKKDPAPSVSCNMETVATQLCQSEWQSNGYSGRCDNVLQTIYLGFDFLLKNFNSDDYEDSAQCQLSGGECKSMQLTHNVRVGVDWGTLPQAQRQRWIELDCNRVVNSNA